MNYKNRNKVAKGVGNKKIISKKFALWLLNIIIFAAVVFFGIEQAGKGAEIAYLEDKFEEKTLQKQTLSEIIYQNTSWENKEKISNLGFAKPSEIVYLDSPDSFAKLPVR